MGKCRKEAILGVLSIKCDPHVLTFKAQDPECGRVRVAPAHPSFPSATSSLPLGPWQVPGHLQFSLRTSVLLTSYKIHVTPSKKPSLAHSRFSVSTLFYDCLSASNLPSSAPLQGRTLQTTFLLCELNPLGFATTRIHRFIVLSFTALPRCCGLFFFFLTNSRQDPLPAKRL